MSVKSQRIKIGNTGKAILGVVAIAGIITTVALFPGVTMVIAPFLKKKKYSAKQSIQRNIDSLVRNGLLKKTIDKTGSVRIELTKRGRWEAFLRAPSQDSAQKKWDSLWRVVIFDIPETKVRERKELRRAMQMFGFKLLQKSVWVYPFPCDDFVALLKDRLGVSHDVLYMKVSHIENDKHLRREFSLS